MILAISIITFLYVALILTYWLGWLSLSDWYAGNQPEPSTKVSIIVPARNEEAYLENCLIAILNQKYPSNLMEVILVNDHSSDNTLAIAQNIQDSRLKIINLEDYDGPKGHSFKKFGIQTAIEQSEGDLILTTDADGFVCDNWLINMVSFYEAHDYKFITGPVVIKCKNRAIEIFQSLDFLGMMGITGASHNFNLSNMANGANLAYEKEAFNEVGGFAGIDDIASGDDMLLMKKIVDRYPNSTAFVKSKEAIVYTKAERNIKDFLNQRIRWASKSSRYQDFKIISILIIGLLFYLSLVLCLGLCLAGQIPWTVLIYQVAAKLLVDFVFLHLLATYFNKRNLLFWYLPFQLFHLFYIVYVGIVGNFTKYNWKGRKVK